MRTPSEAGAQAQTRILSPRDKINENSDEKFGKISNFMLFPDAFLRFNTSPQRLQLTD